MGIVRAHIELAKAESAEILDEVKRAAVSGCAAAAILAFIALLLPIGLTLYLGEWLLGSMGWGILIATELGIGIAMAAILIALRVTGVQWTLAISLIVAALLAIIFGLRWSNGLWRRLAEAIHLTFGSAQGATPLIVGIVVIGIIGAIVGVVIGSRYSGGAAAGGLVAGLLLGVALGALSAITFDRRAGVGTGIFLGLAIWPILMGILVARQGVDTEDLKARFWPDTTIDTAKETIEWVRERTPLGPKS